VEDPDASLDLGDDPATERGLLGGFDQVDLHQTGQLGSHGETREDRGDGSITVGGEPQPRGVDRLESSPRLVDPLGDPCRLGVRAQGGDEAVHRLLSRDERAGVGHEELAVDQLRHELLGLGPADLVVHQHPDHGLPCRSSSSALERCGEMGALVDCDEVVGAAGGGRPDFREAQPTGHLAEAGVGLVREQRADLRVVLDGLGQRPQEVHVEPAVPAVALPRLQAQPGPRADGAGGAPGEQTEGGGPGRGSAEVRHHGRLQLAALPAVRFLLPDLEGLVQAR
jgi:hypothetical protein